MKEPTELFTPSFLVTTSSVTGMVAFELEVEKANICAALSFFIKIEILKPLVNTLNTIINVMNK